MRRLKLSTKMLVAALPLILAVAALLALTVRSDLADIERAETGADLGAMWQPLTTALTAIEHESDPATESDPAARRATDAAVNVLRDEANRLGAAEAAGDHITSSRSSLSAARRNLDMGTIAPDLQLEIDPADAYAQASRELVAVGQLLPAEAGSPELGRELLAVVKLAEAKLLGDIILHDIASWQDDPSDVASLTNARNQFASLETVLGEFEAIAPEEWRAEFRQAGFTTAVARERTEVDRTLRAIQSGTDSAEVEYDSTEFAALVQSGVGYQQEVATSIVDRAEAEASAARSETLRRTGIVLGVGALAVVLAWLISRSITKRIRAVADGANQVSTEQLPALVTALRDPRGKGELPPIEAIPVHGTDELNELAAAFNSIQDTLVDVAQEQVEVLRRGVSDIFVTMARRNRSLIDRQLAMLDEFEAEVDDPQVLANYYQLDHMATRMRRNSESLLVLANAEPKRRRVKATEVDDVVRAAIGEVEDYRRVEIEALESLQVRGNVVADVSHLLAELLDNATSFSPPDSFVRVGGRMSDEGYMVRILDSGVGISTERLKQLNELLREPPVVGLSVESTLGMSVVSLLANKHGITVTLAAGNPGLIVDVLLPPTLFGPIDAEQPRASVGTLDQVVGASGGAAPEAPATAPLIDLDDPVTEPVLAEVAAESGVEASEESADDPIVAWTESDTTEPVEPSLVDADFDDRPSVAAGGWRSMSLNLEAFRSGVNAAADASGNGDTPDLSEFAGSPDEADNGVVHAAETPIPAGAVPGVGGDHNSDARDHTDPELAPPVAATFSAPTLPPPAISATAARAISPTGEFDVPPAPPHTATSPSQWPVSPVTAQQRPQPAPADAAPNLPTRTPGAGPDGGPDRLANDAPAPFGSGADALPTRTRVGEPVEPIDVPLAAAAPTNPEDLRDRLRAFQAEFRSALGTDTLTDPSSPSDDDQPAGHDQSDLGGDRR